MTQNRNSRSLIELPEWHLIQSVRYALLRATYAANDTINSIRSVWPQLSAETRSSIIKDIQCGLARDSNMNSIDRPAWTKLLNQLTSEPQHSN